MSPVTIVVPDDFPISYGSPDHPDLARLRDFGDVQTFTTRFADRAEFFARIKDADVVINVRAYSTFDDEALAQAPALKMISVQGVGTDNVDLAVASRRGVTVTNTPGVNSVSVAELAIGLMIAAVRAIPLSDRRMREGIWQHPPARLSEVELAARAAGFRTRRTGTSVSVLGVEGADGRAPEGERRPANLEDVFVLLTGEEIA